MVKIEANFCYGWGVDSGVGVALRGDIIGVSEGVVSRGLGVTVIGGVTGCLAFEGRGSLGYTTMINVSGIKTKTMTSQIKDTFWAVDRLLYTR